MAIKSPQCLTGMILVTRPGGGKGTTTRRLKEEGYSICSLPFREVLDGMVVEKEEWAMVINASRRAGKLVPLEIMKVASSRAFESITPKVDEILVLDGFPRNRAQIDMALGGLESRGFQRKIILHLECSPVLAAARMARRGRDESDCDPYSILDRMNEFESETLPVIKFLREHHERLGVEFIHYDTNHLEDEFPNLHRVLHL